MKCWGSVVQHGIVNVFTCFWKWLLFLEHEACIRDITELKWQLKLERDKLDQVQEKLSHAEVLNQHLHKDINFSKKQVPIVRDNLEIQGSLIDQINTEQAKVASNLIYSCFKNYSCVYIFKGWILFLIAWLEGLQYLLVCRYIVSPTVCSTIKYIHFNNWLSYHEIWYRHLCP